MCNASIIRILWIYPSWSWCVYLYYPSELTAFSTLYAFSGVWAWNMFIWKYLVIFMLKKFLLGSTKFSDAGSDVSRLDVIFMQRQLCKYWKKYWVFSCTVLLMQIYLDFIEWHRSKLMSREIIFLCLGSNHQNSLTRLRKVIAFIIFLRDYLSIRGLKI